MSTHQKPKLDFAAGLDFSQILTNPILDIAARVWTEDRYQAFRTFYRSMRRIDDLVDHRKAGGQPLSPAEADQFERVVIGWLDSIERHQAEDLFQKEFLATLDQFAVPIWPWQRLCTAMIYDLRHNGFESFRQFLRYAEGASIAPAAVFMHLCGLRQTADGVKPPSFDIRSAARPLAIFSYLVHILRDWRKDHRERLNYFSDDIMDACQITVDEIRTIADTGGVTPEFRQLVSRYLALAEQYRRRARATLDLTLPLVEPRYQLSLELIYQLYLQIFERIAPDSANLADETLGPSSVDVQSRISQTIAQFRSFENPPGRK